MTHTLGNLVDLNILRDLMVAFYRSTRVGSTIIDLEGNIITTSEGLIVGSEEAWQRICSDFHRVNPVSAARCRSSDIHNACDCLGRTSPFYACFNGMIDSATPIVIEGEHIATIFSGQYFFEPPDRAFFQAQARQFGFPEAEYLAALDEVPVLSRTHVEHCLHFLAMLAQATAEMGLMRKRLFVELERSKVAILAAQAAERTRTGFFSSASHDLRQPLQALRLFTDVLEGETRGSRLEPKVQLASKALSGAETIVRSLLDVARLEASSAPPRYQAVDIPSLFAAMADEVSPQAAAKGLDFRVAGAKGAVWSDPLMLERILRNLLTNAVRYTDHGGILLACRHRAGKVLIEVWDTGIGIPEKHQDEIWEEFFQVGNAARDRDQGLGLGLPIVRKLAQRLGCPITLTSKVGRGSRFRLVMDRPQP